MNTRVGCENHRRKQAGLAGHRNRPGINRIAPHQLVKIGKLVLSTNAIQLASIKVSRFAELIDSFGTPLPFLLYRQLLTDFVERLKLPGEGRGDNLDCGSPAGIRRSIR